MEHGRGMAPAVAALPTASWLLPAKDAIYNLLEWSEWTSTYV